MMIYKRIDYKMMQNIEIYNIYIYYNYRNIMIQKVKRRNI